MNKTKMTVVIVGGVAGLLVLAAAFLAWNASSAKTVALEGDYEEGIDGLETVRDQVGSLSRKPIYPCAESVTAIASNRTLVTEWEQEARKLASKGDKIFEQTTPPAFKAFIVADAKRLLEAPGAVAGKIAKPDFAFGPFKGYIAEGKMPEQAELAALQRQWDDVSTVVEILEASGIAELRDVAFGASKPPAYSYVFTFAAKPSAFVKAINALEVAERFIVVDDFGLSRASDVIAEALGGDEKKSGSSGRRRRGRAVEEAKAEAKQPGGVVTDPQQDAPLTVTLSLTVHDFGSLEGDKTEEVKK